MTPSAFLTRKLAAHHQVLADDGASDAQRCRARRGLNFSLRCLREYGTPPPMKRPLEVDRLAARAARLQLG